MASITGTNDADSVAGTPDADTISGLGGDDTLAGNGGRDSLDGGAGYDTADFAGAAGDLDVDLAATPTAGQERALTNAVLVSIEAVGGADGDDALAGDAGPNRLDGRGGEDFIRGFGADDTLLGGSGSNVLDGGVGRDTASYEWAAGAVLANLADGLAEVDDPVGAQLAADDGLLSIENLVGGAAGDTLVGDAAANALSGAGGGDSVSGAAGDDTLAGGAGGDRLEGGAGTDTAAFAGRRADFRVALVTEDSTADGFVVTDARPGGGEGDDTVVGVEFFLFDDGAVPSAELLGETDPGGDAVPTIYGTPLDDRFWFQPGDEIVDGLGGRDWIDMLAEGRRGSVVTARPNGTVEVAHAGQADALLNTEEVRFADGRLVFDPSDPAARVARLYEAALDRLPDQGGLNFWIDAVRDGQSLANLASGFIASPEFQSRFGGAATGNGAFVDRLYANVLGRAGEAEGRKFWVDALDANTGRADVLASFSESAENKAGTAALVQNGIWDRSEAATEVARLYDTVFGRLPDAPGLVSWREALEGGTATLAQVADGFTASAEFSGRYGDLDNRRFADALYRNTLDRAPEQEGLDFWTGRLDAGVSRADVVLAFSESREHVSLTARDIQSENPAEFGILFA